MIKAVTSVAHKSILNRIWLEEISGKTCIAVLLAWNMHFTFTDKHLSHCTKKWFFRIMVFFSKCDYIHNFLWTPYGFGNIYWRLLCSTNSELLISRIWLPHGVLQALDFLLLNYLNYNRLMQALVMKMVLGLTGLTVEQMLLHNVAAVAAAVYKGSYNLMVG